MKLKPYSRFIYNLTNNKNEIIHFVNDMFRLNKSLNKSYLSNKKDIDYFLSEINKINKYNSYVYTEILTHYNKDINHYYFYNDNNQKVEVFI